MSDLAHFTVTTGNLIMSPRGEVDERTLDMLKPIVGAGFGMVAGLSIVLETHQLGGEEGETWVFTLGFKPDEPAVRCWLSRSPNSDLWQFNIAEPPAPWLSVALLDEAANLTPDQLLMLRDTEPCVAWACLEATN